MARCPRCKAVFPDDRLGPPNILLRVVAWPVFLLVMRSYRARNETVASYCPRCRRSVSFALFFVVFCVALFAIAMLMEHFGITLASVLQRLGLI